MKHPIQPLIKDEDILIFKPNAVIQHLVHKGLIHFDDLVEMNFSSDDLEQLAQLSGVSVEKFSTLPYAKKETLTKALDYHSRNICAEDEAKALRNELLCIKTALRLPISQLYRLDPDDLMRVPAIFEL